MSYLSLALNSALADTTLSQSDIARAAHITRSYVNKAVRGTKPIGAKTAEAIARTFPEPQRTQILIGWLKDQLSTDLLPNIEIHPLSLALAEGPARLTRDLPAELPDDIVELLLWLARKALSHTAVRDSLRSLRAAAEAARGN